MIRSIGSCLLLWIVSASENDEKKVRYLRVLGDKTATECIFNLQQTDKNRSITSVTERGTTTMIVVARYDPKDRLTFAEARLAKGGEKKSVRVTVMGGNGKVVRGGQPAQMFDVPAGVIVTSAPDWTDTFLLCRRYDSKKGGKQEFPGLWIHPEQPAKRLTFTIERVGANRIDHDGKKLELGRFLITIRNSSEYMAWADDKGGLVKLVSLPVKEKAATMLVQEGYEKSAAKLRPGR